SISRRTLSTSAGYTFSPPTLITSDFRPRKRKYCPSTSTASPVLYQPSSVKGEGALRYPSMAERILSQSTPSTTLLQKPSPPSFNQRESELFARVFKIPSSESP